MYHWFWEQARLRFSWQQLGTQSFGFFRTVCACYVFSKYGVFVSKVSGPSMCPTFTGRGDIVLAEAVTPIWSSLQPGDIIICTRPVDPSESIIKRVVAVEGSEVVIYPDREHSTVRRVTADPNEVQSDGSEVLGKPKRIKVPRGHIWIQGDNLPASLDSRQYGPIPIALVKGRVFFQLWPRFGLIDDTLYKIKQGLS